MLKSLDYKENYTNLIPEGNFRISPSAVSKFSDRKWEWYQSQVLGNVTFMGNTSTVLGTCVHRCAEVFSKCKTEEERAFIRDEIPSYINSFTMNPDVDVAYCLDQWRPMGQAVINFLTLYGIPERSEDAIAAKLMEGVYVGGTADALIGDTIIDYKTTSMMSPNENVIPHGYKLQLLTYAWIYRKLGIEVNNMKLIWITPNAVGRISEKTGKAMKDYPSRAIPITIGISQEDMDFIEGYLKLIGETYLKAKERPELTYLLYGDYRLKDNPNSLL